MAELTRISWTDHTFNPWTGCLKVDDECTNCYAYTWAERYGRDVFGALSKRKRTNKSVWAKPRAYNRAAELDRRPRKVFCASLADVFEDAPGPNEWRPDVFDLIRETPWLDWQLLTKRPENIAAMLPADWGEGWPHVWLGTSIGKREYVDRAQVLAAVPAFNHFISYEPALGPIFPLPEDYVAEEGDYGQQHASGDWLWPDGTLVDEDNPELDLTGIDWLICGGESGGGFRDMDLRWARDARERCGEADVAFFFKQVSDFRNEQGADALGEVVQDFPASWDRAELAGAL